MDEENRKINMYLKALDRIEMVIYTIVPLNDITADETYRAKNDILEAVQNLRNKISSNDQESAE